MISFVWSCSKPPFTFCNLILSLGGRERDEGVGEFKGQEHSFGHDVTFSVVTFKSIIIYNKFSITIYLALITDWFSAVWPLTLTLLRLSIARLLSMPSVSLRIIKEPWCTILISVERIWLPSCFGDSSTCYFTTGIRRRLTLLQFLSWL